MKITTKNIIRAIVFAPIILIVISFTNKYSVNQQSTKDKIIGSWVSDSDSKSIWVFSIDNKCKLYYNRSLLNTYDFSISNTSCSNEVDSEYEYLELIKNTEKSHCYAINGITQDGNDIYLSLEFNVNPIPILFKKQ